jgi:hypothetical protein
LSLFLLSSNWQAADCFGRGEKQMTTKLFRYLSVALLAAASVYAQGSQKMIVDIPFGFHVGNSVLPSGKYTVDADAGVGLVKVRSADAKSSVMILSIGVQTSTTPSTGKLVFNKYGDDYFLSQIWKSGDTLGRELHKSRREVEVAASTRRGTSIVASQ